MDNRTWFKECVLDCPYLHAHGDFCKFYEEKIEYNKERNTFAKCNSCYEATKFFPEQKNADDKEIAWYVRIQLKRVIDVLNETLADIERLNGGE
jgi:hypothetical protein